MSLSDRFAKLKSQPAAVGGRINRQVAQKNSTKDKRTAQTQGKRGMQSTAPTRGNGNNSNGKKKGV